MLAAPRPGDAGIEAGMILSNEPGYYKEGDYGIRIENLVVAVPRDIPGAMKPMLGFETITMAPIDPVLIDTALRSEEHTSELQSLMRISYAVFCLKKKNNT